MYDAYQAYIEAGGGEAGAIAVLEVFGTNAILGMTGGIAMKGIAKGATPCLKTLRALMDNNPVIKMIITKAETKIAAGAAAARNKATQVTSSVSSSVSNSAAGRAVRQAAQRVEEAAAKVGVKLKKKPTANPANAKSAADAARLRTELKFKEAGILDKNGKLTEKAIKESDIIPLSSGGINNPAVIKELTKDGSKITDWKKYRTEHVTAAYDQKLQIHYYKNIKTGKIDYKTSDYKVNGTVTAHLPNKPKYAKKN